MQEAHRKPFIFIVYQNSEHTLAVGLQRLFEEWGYNVFQCRQGDRDGQAYRAELRENLRKSDVAVILLSREFQWSPYCQTEAGTVMALEKPYVPVLVPPARREDVGNEIAPVLEGVQLLYAADPNFISLLQAAVAKAIGRSKDSLKKLISRLQEIERSELSDFAPTNVEEDDAKRAYVHASIRDIESRYRLSQPKKRLLSLWPSLADSACKTSIVGNMTNCLGEEDDETVFTFAGVSLKYSLHLISDALEAFSKSAK